MASILNRLTILIFLAFLAFTACEKNDDTGQIAPEFNSSISYGTMTDQDGNEYKTVTIGDQTWMAENLKTTSFSDGAPIPLVTDAAEWSTLNSPGYCWYNNDENGYSTAYGALYNWFAVESGKLCPSGWHVPDLIEWRPMIEFLGGTSIAGGKLKESGTTHWLKPNEGASNESGFTALPGGIRSAEGLFYYEGDVGYWWSKNPHREVTAYGIYLDKIYKESQEQHSYRASGESVRCVQD